MTREDFVTYGSAPGLEEANAEARRRWPHGCRETDGMPFMSWGAAKDGLFRAVGIGTFDVDQVEEPMIDFKLLGYGPTWADAFADADRRMAHPGKTT